MESANTEPTDYSQWSKEELEYGISKVTFEIIALKRWIAFKREMRETEAVAADEYEEEEISAEDAARDAKREAVRLPMFALPAVDLAIASIAGYRPASDTTNCREIELLTLIHLLIKSLASQAHRRNPHRAHAVGSSGVERM